MWTCRITNKQKTLIKNYYKLQLLFDKNENSRKSTCLEKQLRQEPRV